MSSPGWPGSRNATFVVILHLTTSDETAEPEIALRGLTKSVTDYRITGSARKQT